MRTFGSAKEAEAAILGGLWEEKQRLEGGGREREGQRYVDPIADGDELSVNGSPVNITALVDTVNGVSMKDSARVGFVVRVASWMCFVGLKLTCR